MSKAALVSLLAEKFDLSKSLADEMVSTVWDGVTSSLVSQGSFSYVGFGRMQLVYRGPRPGRNPNTGEPLQIEGRWTVKFTAGERLKREINVSKKK